MKKMTLEEMKRVEFDILVKFDELCKEHNLRYYIAYGTLIGAVRHKGFIPWDDDIDVVMPRPDYEKLCDLYRNKLVGEHYRLIDSESKDYIYAFAKFFDTNTHIDEQWMITNILGVYIDIFPLDGLPSNEKQRIALVKKTLRYHYYLLLTSRKNKSRKNMIKTALSYIAYYPMATLGYKRWIKKIENLITQIGYEESQLVGNLAIDTYIKKQCFDRKWFEEAVDLQFEGRFFPAPKGYDLFLKKIYGNYMELPPKEQRIKKHENNAFWI